MSALAVGGIAFGWVFGGAVFGMLLGAILPKHHLSADSKDVIKVAIAMIATLAALVVDLLISSAKNSREAIRSFAIISVRSSVVTTTALMLCANPSPVNFSTKNQIRVCLFCARYLFSICAPFLRHSRTSSSLSTVLPRTNRTKSESILRHSINAAPYSSGRNPKPMS